MEYNPRAWTMNQKIKRSAKTRWLMVVYLAVLVGLIVACLSGLLNSVSGNSFPTVIVIFAVLLFMQSPFRPRPSKKSGQGGITHVPDEFEIQAFQNAQSKANIWGLLSIIAVFIWLGVASDMAWIHPQGFTSWLTLGAALAYFSMVLPFAVAEWTVPLLDGDENADEEL
jgi:hypothetical protein